MFPDIRVNTICPEKAEAAAPTAITKPAVLERPPVVLDCVMVFPVDVYPDESTDPAPTCIRGCDDPLRETPLNITVIRLIQLGIPVKSMLVPDVEF